jgi:excisionase family DNA binding protein
MNNNFIGMKEAVKKLGVSRYTIVNLIKAGQIRYIKLPKGRYLVDVQDYLNRSIVEPVCGSTFDKDV